jgi:hypothetical protein
LHGVSIANRRDLAALFKASRVPRLKSLKAKDLGGLAGGQIVRSRSPVTDLSAILSAHRNATCSAIPSAALEDDDA